MNTVQHSLPLDPGILGALGTTSASKGVCDAKASGNETPLNENPTVCKMVMEALLRGLDPESIAAICNISVSAVERYATSEWFSQEVQKRASSGEVKDDSLRALVRSRAFVAVIRLGKLISSSNENVALGASRLALEYSMKKASDLDVNKGHELPSPEEIARESVELQRKLDRLRNK